MKLLWPVIALLACAGCGESESDSAAAATTSAGAAAAAASTPPPVATTPATAAAARGTTITLRRSQFGRILFDAKRQAIYIFENDRPKKTVCYGECARAWPPVYTRGRPRAAGGVRPSLLGTITRRDGRRQVTYAGKPLYYYAHERPGEVRCHNVDLNGGLWWVVGANGRRRP